MPNTNSSRRTFIRQVAAAGSIAAIGSVLPRGVVAEESPMTSKFKHRLRKAMMGPPDKHTLTTAKANGFEAIETWNWDVTPDAAKQGRELAEKIGVRIHSVIRAWVPFDHPDPKEVDKYVETVKRALYAAEGYGADDILLVSSQGPQGVKVIPAAWEFDIEMDEKGIVSRVVKGDNTKYQPYIEAHNKATLASHEVMKRLTPICEKTGVAIGLENVWNNLWVTPQLFKVFLEGHNHPMVRPYFDCANNVKYGVPPETWIRTLGKPIIKVHIKEYRLAPDGRSGVWTHLRENGINWPEVRKALDEVGFDSFGTIEDSGAQPRLSTEEQSRQYDLIVAGK